MMNFPDFAVPEVLLSSVKDRAFCFLLCQAVKSLSRNFHTDAKIPGSVLKSDKNKFYVSVFPMHVSFSDESPESASGSEFFENFALNIFQHPGSRP